MARECPDVNIGISTWGANHQSLLLELASAGSIPKKLTNRLPEVEQEYLPNCTEYFKPAYTWTRKFRSGNIRGIVDANWHNLKRFEQKYSKVDLIHAHVSHPGGYVAMELSQKLKVPYVITEHMSPFPFQSYILTDGKLSDWITNPLNKASKVICVSNYLSSIVKDRVGIDSQVINNFVDDSFFSLGNTQGKESSKIRLLFVGRLVAQKGVDLLIRAFEKIKDSVENVELIIAGEGEDKSDYQKLGESLGVMDHIQWPGNLSREEVRDEMQKCDLFVLPSRHENNPLVLLEAIACGKPIVTTKCNGAEEIVNETNGFICEINNVNNLYLTIERAIGKLDDFDPPTIRKDFSKYYSAKTGTVKILSMYTDILFN